MSPNQKQLKRYLVFACDQYYPSGGWGDFKESFDTVEEARAAYLKAENHFDFTWIIDRETGEDFA